MLRRTLISALAALAATVVAAAPSFAQRGNPIKPTPWDDPQRGREEEQRDVPLGQVIRDLKMQFGGQHLDAKKEGDRYVIAWITGDGKRLTIVVDARTGRTISVR